MSINWQQHYQQPDSSLWQGRRDAQKNEYIFNTIQCLDIQTLSEQTAGLALLGFQSDAGVVRNLGRPGAKQGPKALRSQLAKLPLHRALTLYDVGDIVCQGDDLENAQAALGKAVSHLLQQHHHPIILGGGHETAWGHYLGINDFLTGNGSQQKLAIVNFDAHFDLRDQAQGSSGTPFKQIADHNAAFDYTVIGIQSSANNQTLFKTAKRLGVHTVLADDIHHGYQLNDTIDAVIARADCIYLTICLDVFSASIAPGVSAPQCTGLYLGQILPAMLALIKSGKVISYDLVELAPHYDCDHHTAKLAAHIIWELIHHDA